jgi:hypothetical protein
VYIFIKKNLILGIILLFLISIFSFQKSLEEINYGINASDRKAMYWLKILQDKYILSDKFSIYDYHFDTIDSSLIFSLYMDSRDKISTSAKKLAIMTNPPQTTPSGTLIIFDELVSIYDVSASDSSTLQSLGWARINPEDIYNSTEHWLDLLKK